MIQSGARAGISRRTFLKTAALAAGAAAAAESLSSNLAGTSTANADEAETVFWGTCRPNCFAYCAVDVHVRDGRMVKTSRGEHYNGIYNRICQRGLSHVQRVYDPERVLYPMLRKEGTERGEGQFERITWDDAFALCAKKITEIQAEYGNSSVFFYGGSGNFSAKVTTVYGRLSSLIQASTVGACVDQASAYGLTAACGTSMPNLMVMAWNGNEPSDAVNAKSIVVWGANITDAQVQNWHLIRRAQKAGVKLYVVDPIFTQVAAKADRWFSIRPGADTLLKHAIMNVIISRGAVDVDFMANHTVAPYLVREDNGMYVRAADLQGAAAEETADEEAIAAASANVVLVGGVPTVLADGVVGDIEGAATINGVACKTAYQLLKDMVAAHSPAAVADRIEMSVEDIEALADICIDGPVYHYEGYGPQAYDNGVATTIAGYTMCALTGNLGKPGASYGAFWGLFVGYDSAFAMPAGPSLSPSVASVDLYNVVRERSFAGVPVDPKMLYIYAANVVNTNVSENTWIHEILPNMEFVVTADCMMTDTARYSDLVLPIAQWFEHSDITIAGQTGSISYNEKAIDPLGEAKEDWDIVCGIGKALGLGEYFEMDGDEVLVQLMGGFLPQMFGVDVETLKQKRVVRLIPGDPESDPFIAWRDGVFDTTDQRLSFYREAPAVRIPTTKTASDEEMRRERLPEFYPPMEAWPENDLYAKYPFVLMSERPRYRVHSQWYNTPLLRELDPEPFVKINPTDAAAKGLEDGSLVECFNDHGHAVARLVCSEAIKPGTMVYPKSWQKHQHVAGSWSELSNPDFNVFSVNCNFMDILCDVRLWTGEEK